VYSVERVPELGEEAFERLRALGYDNIETRVGDGYAGWPEHAPYDGIIVTAAAPFIPPALVEQLKPGGRLVIPVGERFGRQDLMLVEKGADGALHEKTILGVAFVPLIGDKREPAV
jgi:protein-L-isoaspartate(D-aspartate) O-methyltransferase